MSEILISFDKVSKSFGSLSVIEELDLSIEKGEFISMLGPSGSGKTTILMMLAGFEKPTSGTIALSGRRIDTLPPYKRNMGVVFQNYALFPHLTVAENVAFPLRMRGLSRPVSDDRVKRALEMVQLAPLADRKPSQLSGGQQQRVALARALVFEPQLVLMDEPLGALDKKLREQMQLDIRELHHRLGLTIVFVTHDQTEALTMSDRIAVFNRGRIEQLGRPGEIYDRPASRFVAEFVGETNLIACNVVETSEDHALVELPSGQRINIRNGHLRAGSKATLSVRPERFNLGPGAPGSNVVAGTVTDVIYHGDHLQIMLDAGEQRFLIKSNRASPPEVGGPCHAHFSPDDCWVVEA